MHPLETYIDRLHEIRASRRGTPELSYRAALENLLNSIGAGLDPPVQATAELADAGEGRPDFGLMEVRSGNMRAVVEVKPAHEDTPQTADGEQVSRYWKRYGCVLVTNYRDFLLVVREPDGKARVEAQFRLATDAESFWQSRPRKLAQEQGEALSDYLIGVLTRTAPITRPTDLAADLARHAREAKRRIEQHDVAALAPLQTAMEQALGLHFIGAEGMDFFRSSLVQTLFYGLFSGWMLWRQIRKKTGDFNWKDASEHLALPLIGDLYEEIARPNRLGDLELREPLEWATTSLNRVVDEFFERFDADHAITLFYEPFLEAFDPNLRKQLGVWYTPPEIVKYQVARVDQLLRSELGIEDGLADENVYVLDPACGTGSYLIEVARTIHATLSEQGHGSLAAAKVKKALSTRIFGFEILPAPYVVAHLQLGIVLRSMGTSYARKERCEVYFTNALNGWQPPKGPKQTLGFKFLDDERDGALRVKRKAPILVILGNPPYNAFAGVAQEEEADLIKPYKEGLYENWGVSRQSLDDLYIRFFRVAEWRIGEAAPQGIVSFISNYSWLDGLSHPIMRQRLLQEFDQIWIDNCNGDKYKTGKRTPDGLSDQSMFTTDEHPVGIQVGTAIACLVKTAGADERDADVYYRDLWGLANEKRAELLRTLRLKRPRSKYIKVKPRTVSRLMFTPSTHEAGYYEWPSLADLTLHQFIGVETCRDEFLIGIDRESLEQRMRSYFDRRVSDEQVKEICPAAMRAAAHYDPHEIRARLLKRGFQPGRVRPISYRPFDDRYLYWELEVELLNRRRPELAKQVEWGSMFLITSNEREKLAGFDRVFFSEFACEKHLLRPDASAIPLLIRVKDLNGNGLEPNFKVEVLRRLCELAEIELFQDDGHHYSTGAVDIARRLFYHASAVLWSSAYRSENESGLRQGWPRIPIPQDPRQLEESSELGKQIADFLSTDKFVKGVTRGTVRPELRGLGNAMRIDGENIESGSGLRVDAGWGFRGQKNAVMCGKGRVEPSAVDPENAVDVFLNSQVYWSNVPKDVWEMTIGGYPVIKKWLSYREFKVLGRPLQLEEVTYITEVVRRLKALLLLGPELDANYEAAKESALVWPLEGGAAGNAASMG